MTDVTKLKSLITADLRRRHPEIPGHGLDGLIELCTRSVTMVSMGHGDIVVGRDYITGSPLTAGAVMDDAKLWRFMTRH